jgi:hypothetical protein
MSHCCSSSLATATSRARCATSTSRARSRQGSCGSASPRKETARLCVADPERNEILLHLDEQAKLYFDLDDYDPLTELMKSSRGPKRTGRQRDRCSSIVAEYVHSKRKPAPTGSEVKITHESWLQTIENDGDRWST